MKLKSSYECPPSGLIENPAAENEARAELSAVFETELCRLIQAARAKAELIGGPFRGPGIKAELNRILGRAKI